MAKARGRPKKAKQGYLSPDLEPPRIKVLDDAADIYYDVMQDRVKLSKEEDEAKTNLIEKMKSEGIDRYETADGLVVEVLNKSNVKVKKKKEADAEADESEE